MTTLPNTEAALSWLSQHEVRSLSVDSRRLPSGAAFIAWPGHVRDGRQYVHQALADGARACLVEAQGAEAFDLDGEPRVAAVVGLKAATGELASAFMGRPSRRLRMVATTGTNGKTSTAWWTAQAHAALQRRCAVVGTLGAGEPPSASNPDTSLEFTGMTTPDPVTLQALLRRFVDAGIEACAIEASSIGLVEHRLDGTHFDVALFTNLTQDHLDFHGSMAGYWQAKRQLFDWPGLKAAVVNLDDAHGAQLAASLAGGPLSLWTCSAAPQLHPAARLQASEVGYEQAGLRMTVREAASAQGAAQTAELRTALLGDFNVANLLAVIGGLRALDVPLADAVRACTSLTPVPGRMQRVDGSDGRDVAAAGPEVVVDYAHTPDAIEKALLSLQTLVKQRGGRLWCVFGCGGNRDVGKRPLMAAAAQRLAQRLVVTTDNPRDEAPGHIIDEILAGLSGRDGVDVIEDRRAAIAHAVGNAAAQDVVLLAGKGHEEYQEVAGVKHAFSDVALAREQLQRRSTAS